jgi:hypothetical protein
MTLIPTASAVGIFVVLIGKGSQKNPSAVLDGRGGWEVRKKEFYGSWNILWENVEIFSPKLGFKWYSDKCTFANLPICSFTATLYITI